MEEVYRAEVEALRKMNQEQRAEIERLREKLESLTKKVNRLDDMAHGRRVEKVGVTDGTL